MAHSMWRGVISFGLVSIPVRLFVATESHAVSFRQLCGEHLAPIRQKRWCDAGDHEVAFSDLKKGYEVSPDNYVEVDDADLEKLPLPTVRTIAISEFVPLTEIAAGLYFKGAYYVEPEEFGRKPYQLLCQVLDESRVMAVAKVAFRDREHLCALHPLAGHLLLNTLHWPDEIRSPDGQPARRVDVQTHPNEVKMAKSLVQALLQPEFDPNRYRDDYREALMRLVNAKIEGNEVVSAPAPATGVMNLMEALKTSVEEAKKHRATERRPAKKPARTRSA
ncbi:MAG: Ku protein [Candidatus Dormibacteraeota bacterium]|nr:Ku protein [Candidatus Dormibacteraeota bacterium]